jgi:hypothetical protein
MKWNEPVKPHFSLASQLVATAIVAALLFGYTAGSDPDKRILGHVCIAIVFAAIWIGPWLLKRFKK